MTPLTASVVLLWLVVIIVVLAMAGQRQQLRLLQEGKPEDGRVTPQVTGLVCILAVLVGCTPPDSERPAARPSSSTTGVASPAARPSLNSVAQDLLPQLRRGGQPRVASNLPAKLDLPRREPQELLQSLPGRAVAAVVRYDRNYAAEGWADQTVFFFGIDGEWRRLNLGSLGASDAEWPGADGSGIGTLSPRGRWWAFQTTTRVGTVNLSSGRIRLFALPGGRQPIFPRWTAWNTLLVGDAHRRTMSFEIEPGTGNTSSAKRFPPWRTATVAFPERLWAVYSKKSDRVSISYVRRDGSTFAERTFPFSVPSRWADAKAAGLHSGTRVVLPVDLEPERDNPDRPGLFSLAVADAVSLELEHSLKWRNYGEFDAPLGWISETALLIRVGNVVAMWEPERKRLLPVADVSSEVLIGFALAMVSPDIGNLD